VGGRGIRKSVARNDGGADLAALSGYAGLISDELLPAEFVIIGIALNTLSVRR
jgi:hypothetical protein